MSELNQRLERMERQVRVLRRWVVGLGDSPRWNHSIEEYVRGNAHTNLTYHQAGSQNIAP